jgi:hypothetical protein
MSNVHRPNVRLVTSEHRFDRLGIDPDVPVRTPNLDVAATLFETTQRNTGVSS